MICTSLSTEHGDTGGTVTAKAGKVRQAHLTRHSGASRNPWTPAFAGVTGYKRSQEKAEVAVIGHLTI
jgi:hypothetical protein